MSTMADVFNELFFGAGAWLGLIIMLAIMIGMLGKFEYTGVLLFPISILLGLTYLEHDLGWPAIIMFFSGIFILVFMMKKIKT